LARDALPTLFASKARDAVLRLFMCDPLRSYYQRQIEQATGLAIRAVQREVERLSKIGLLYRREEGNRIYYHADLQHPIFEDLRSMVLKTGSDVERLRGWAAMNDRVRLLFLNADEKKALVVTTGKVTPPDELAEAFTIETITSETFVDALTESPEKVAPFLAKGVDLLGRRDDVIWRRIELAGFTVPKRKGVA